MGQSTQGRVVSLQLNVGHKEPLQQTESVSFIKGEGIEGDRHATPRVERRDFQVLLIEEETLQSFDLAAGEVRENVTTAGIDLASLPSGQRLAIGDEVVLQISKACAPCSRIEEIRPGLQKEMEGRRGMLASVEKGGPASVGDAVSLV